MISAARVESLCREFASFLQEVYDAPPVGTDLEAIMNDPVYLQAHPRLKEMQRVAHLPENQIRTGELPLMTDSDVVSRRQPMDEFYGIRMELEVHMECMKLLLENWTEPQSCLDVGCGWGSYLGFLIRKRISKRGMRLCAMDPSPVMRKHAREILAQAVKSLNVSARPSFSVDSGYAQRLAYKNESFDLVYSFEMLHWSEMWQACLTEMTRVLAPGGKLALSYIIRYPRNGRIPPSQVEEILVRSGLEITENYDFTAPSTSLRRLIAARRRS